MMQVDVIELDGEKFVILPDSVLEQCRVGDVVDMSVEDNYIVLKAMDKGMRLTNIQLEEKKDGKSGDWNRA